MGKAGDPAVYLEDRQAKPLELRVLGRPQVRNGLLRRIRLPLELLQQRVCVPPSAEGRASRLGVRRGRHGRRYGVAFGRTDLLDAVPLPRVVELLDQQREILRPRRRTGDQRLCREGVSL